MQCRNHPEAAAVDRCTGCAEAFCGDCLLTIHGQKYCGACKTMTLRGGVAVPLEGNYPCKEAREALTFALIGFFFFGFIFGPAAIMKAVKARKSIEENPRLDGWGKANAALVIAIVVVILSALNIAFRIKNFKTY